MTRLSRKTVPFLDLTPAFRVSSKTGARLNFARDGHWNPAGHRVAADAIEAWLERESLSVGN